MEQALQADRYYSVHLSRWPMIMLWKHLWRNAPLLSWLLFPVMLIQRLPGLKPFPQFANAYPRELTKISGDQIPPHARTAIDARVRDAEQIGFQLCAHFQSQSLGTYEQFDSLLVGPSGEDAIHIRWHRMKVNRYLEQDCRVHCFSVLRDGGVLGSNAIDEKKAPKDYRMPDDQSRFYPETTTVAELVDYHRAAVGNHPELRRFDCISVEDFVLKRTQRVIETMLERRVYFEPTERELQKLREREFEWSA